MQTTSFEVRIIFMKDASGVDFHLQPFFSQRKARRQE
jgi:hypothetical protein